MSQFFSIAYNATLKQIKKNLGSRCTFLANRISRDNARYIDVRIKTKEGIREIAFEFPYDLSQVNKYDYEFLEESIRKYLD